MVVQLWSPADSKLIKDGGRRDALSAKMRSSFTVSAYLTAGALYYARTSTCRLLLPALSATTPGGYMSS